MEGGHQKAELGDGIRKKAGGGTRQLYLPRLDDHGRIRLSGIPSAVDRQLFFILSCPMTFFQPLTKHR